jgi:hypothetical protein
MLLDERVGSAERSLFLAQVMAMLHADASTLAMSNFMTPVAGVADGYFKVQATSEFPRWFLWRKFGRWLLFIDGCPSAAMGLALVNGYVSPDFTSPRPPYNTFANSAARAIGARMVVNGLVATVNLDVIGYSLGGAIATIVPLLQNTDPWRWENVNITTFGAPRAVTSSETNAIRVRARVVRWMNQGDPVPFIPPTTIQANGWIWGRFENVQPRLLSFRHTVGGVVLEPSAVARNAVLPTLAILNVVGDLATWLFNEDSSTAHEHSIDKYVDRLTGFRPREPSTHAQPDPVVEPPRVERRREETAAVNQQIQTIFRREATQNSAPLLIPRAQRFAAERRLRVWVVTFRGTVVCIAGRKQKARQLARRANALLDGLQATAVVDPFAIVNQLGAYFEDAQQINLGFSPPLNTQIS